MSIIARGDPPRSGGRAFLVLANHRARSRRSYARHASAMRGIRRYSYGQQARSTGGAGMPLIYRLQAFKRRVMEHRKKREAEGGAEE